MAKHRNKQAWQDKQKKSTLSMLKALSDGIKNGRFTVRQSGWWNANIGNRVNFHVEVVHDQEEAILDDLEQS